MYEKYLMVPCSISMDEASKCFTEIYDAVKGTQDEILTEVYQDFVNACCRYAGIRAEWASLTREERIEKDPGRTSAHNKVIDTHNILARYMTKTGLSTKWHATIGYDKEDRMTRKKLGDFACYISLLLGLESR